MEGGRGGGRGVEEAGEDMVDFHEAAGPAVDEEERDGICAVGTMMDEVEGDGIGIIRSWAGGDRGCEVIVSDYNVRIE